MSVIQTFWKPYIYEMILKTFPAVLARREKRWLDKKFVDVRNCPDNASIPRHPQAGQIVDNYQVMHNGLKIVVDSYSSEVNRNLLTALFKDNKGVHEPAEEYAFQEILKTMPEEATMLELGSFWAFYSMWFCSQVKKPHAYMIEPDPERLENGRKNFVLNGFSGNFFNYFIGKTTGQWQEPRRSLFRGTYYVESKTRQINIDDFMKENKIEFIDILHSDIHDNMLAFVPYSLCISSKLSVKSSTSVKSSDVSIGSSINVAHSSFLISLPFIRSPSLFFII